MLMEKNAQTIVKVYILRHKGNSEKIKEIEYNIEFLNDCL